MAVSISNQFDPCRDLSLDYLLEEAPGLYVGRFKMHAVGQQHSAAWLVSWSIEGEAATIALWQGWTCICWHDQQLMPSALCLCPMVDSRHWR